MFRQLYEAAARLIDRWRAGRTALNPLVPSQEARAPAPYVRRLPSPYEARWRRWAKRCRATGYRLPPLCDDAYWPTPRPPRRPRREATDDVVRAYVLRP
ncbi:hypothetical protein [Streptomyces sp. NPDC007984]|uniref:hypothetical protein n=1 Tax=Streptomyces sp. NPDC007984 TaxID=3364801 RepID=UPI0036EC1A82